MEIKEVIITNILNDYDLLTNGDTLRGAVCVIGTSYSNFVDIFHNNPYWLMLKKKNDLLKVQDLIPKRDYFFLGIKLAFVYELRLEDEIVSLYQVFNKKIRRVKGL